MNKGQLYTLFVVINLITISSTTNGLFLKETTCPGNLVLKTNGGGIYPDYGLFVAQQLRKLGIEVEVTIEEWATFVGTLCITRDFDLGIRTFDFSTLDPDPTKHFSVASDMNYEGLEYDMPYVNESEELIQQALSNTNLTQRTETYIEWSNLVMDKIVPVLPLFNERKTIFLWPNTQGYEVGWGLVESLPHIRFDGYHEGQVSLDSFNLALPHWRGLNPLDNTDSVSDFMIDFITEPIIQIHPSTHVPLNTGLIENWEMINETYYSFRLRDNLYWNPSFNAYDRNSNSLPLNSSDLSSLMIGLQGEFSDGTNQKLAAKDVVFTLLAYGNPSVSKHSAEYNWIKEIELNQTDEFSFNLIVDGNLGTPELNPYAPMWSKLSVPCLPEFFLNSTDLNSTETTGGIPMVGLYEGIEETEEWEDYRKSGFGCGKYLIDYVFQSVDNSITVFKANPNWYNISAIDGSVQYLNISTINVRVLQDDSAKKAEFSAGKLDLYKPEIPFDYQFDPFFIPQTIWSSEVSCLFFNLGRPFVGWNDNYVNSTFEGKEEYSKAVTVRKAISYAINREEINEVMNHRWYSFQHGLINQLFSQYSLSEIFDYEHNLDTAIEWLTGVRPVTPTPTKTPSNPITTISFGINFLYGILATTILISLFKKRKILK